MLSAELKAFYMVARLGSITLAAKKLGLSQPTVTTQIRHLESQYSVELFYRGGRRLTVSEDGARLLPMVKTLLQQEADIEFFLRNSGQVQGVLRIAATAPYYILDLVKTFRERLPQVEVSWKSATPNRCSSPLRNTGSTSPHHRNCSKTRD